MLKIGGRGGRDIGGGWAALGMKRPPIAGRHEMETNSQHLWHKKKPQNRVQYAKVKNKTGVAK
jgi:hypothetical protein